MSDTPTPVHRQLFVLGLKRAMYEREMNQASLSNASGVHQSYLSKVLRGDRSPSQDTQEDLRAALGFNWSQIYRWGEERLAMERLQRQEEVEKKASTDAILAVLKNGDIRNIEQLDEIIAAARLAKERLAGKA